MSQSKPAESTKLGQTLDFMQRLWALDHSLQAASKRMETTMGVTGPQRLVIRVLDRIMSAALVRED